MGLQSCIVRLRRCERSSERKTGSGIEKYFCNQVGTEFALYKAEEARSGSRGRVCIDAEKALMRETCKKIRKCKQKRRDRKERRA